MKDVFLGTAICMLAVAACAGDAESPGPSPLKVDLQRVTETGAVQPVNGMTSSGQPDEAALEVFANNGYTAVIDLRTEGESRGLDEAAVVERLGMAYVSFPVSRGGINFESARQLNKLISEYDAPVLIHCGSGNRVGALLALRASLDGADDEAALAAGREGGMTRLEPRVREALKGK